MTKFKTTLKITVNSAFVYTNHLLQCQTLACYVNAIPLKRVGKNLRWLIYIAK